MNSLSLAAFTCLLACALSTPLSSWDDVPLLNDEEIDRINSDPRITWKAGRNPGYDTARQTLKLLGVDMEMNSLYNQENLAYPELVYPSVNLPKSFDAREQWPDCTTMKEIRDQSNCGSCWAFGSAEAMSDRTCVANKTNVVISADDILACCTDCGDGCRGGYPAAAYQYWINSGVVSGGPYGSKQGCMPYEVAHCPRPTPECSKLHETPTCKPQCQPGYGKSYKQDKHFGKTSYGVKGVDNIMKEIYTNGPLTAAFDVYSDFMSYKSGVYKHTVETKVGAHAVKILGWGVEDGQDYWLVANSWTRKWGMKGYFKIAKGSDECGIESNIVAGIPNTQTLV